MYKGIFWCKDPGSEVPFLLTKKVLCDLSGNPLEEADFSAKSGENFNHKWEWAQFHKTVTGNKAFDHYPRGRVEIKNGKVRVFLNPALDREDILQMIKAEFELSDLWTPDHPGCFFPLPIQHGLRRV